MSHHALQRAFGLFEIINRGSEDMICIHDAKGHCLFQRYLHRSPRPRAGEMIGKRSHDLIRPEAINCWTPTSPIWLIKVVMGQMSGHGCRRQFADYGIALRRGA